MKTTILTLLTTLALGSLITGCASTQPIAYSGIKSSSLLVATSHEKGGRIPYAYQAKTDWQKYKCVMVDPVIVYEGQDNQFEKASPEDKQELANYMETKFRNLLKQNYELVDFATPGTLRVKITLTGAKPSVPVLGTFTRLDLSGGIYNLVQSARGKEGAFTGWVNFAVEIYDADSDQLLKAYVEKQYPCAMNIAATVGKWDAAKKGIDKGAKDLVAKIPQP